MYQVVLGLPPSEGEVEAFVQDPSPGAVERLVDRILSNPRYGERWGRHWLDVVRYADSNGFETNRERKTAYPYRDYVIRSFNGDVPYDRFVREQVAGDALGADLGTGFLVAGAFDLVKSPDINLTLMQRQDELADIINTTGTAFLGLTLGCARCHDHKFDPVSQKDYYALQAVFAGVGFGDRTLPVAPSPEGELEMTSGPSVWLGTFSQPTNVHRLHRGEPLQPREVVGPDAVTVLGSLGLAADAPERDRRLRLAEWLTRPENPLVARVLVNRVWHYLFGTGLVDTPSDFGANGGRPTHPELLDWLADDFIRGGWSIKRLQRQILLSRAFRQSSSPRDDGLGVDAGARLLWRFPPRRLEAEAIRDGMLAVSGALDLRMGGPGFHLQIVEEDNVYRYFPKESFGVPEFRRMVYLSRIRQEQDSVFGAFDCPSGNQVISRRTRSNTPLQALNLFNSNFVLQQADLLAGRLRIEAGPEPARQVEHAFRHAFGRVPDRIEQDASVALVRQAGLPALCRALFNTSEFLFVF